LRSFHVAPHRLGVNGKISHNAVGVSVPCTALVAARFFAARIITAVEATNRLHRRATARAGCVCHAFTALA
jgi:hypothetical protein